MSREHDLGQPSFVIDADLSRASRSIGQRSHHDDSLPVVARRLDLNDSEQSLSPGTLMAVPVHGNALPAGASAPFSFGTTQELFDGLAVQTTLARFGYQPTADGQRFLVAEPANDTLPITVVLNWRAGLKR